MQYVFSKFLKDSKEKSVMRTREYVDGYWSVDQVKLIELLKLIEYYSHCFNATKERKLL
jgi:hypothetical protein